jgi:hypothetical protein
MGKGMKRCQNIRSNQNKEISWVRDEQMFEEVEKDVQLPQIG